MKRMLEPSILIGSMDSTSSNPEVEEVGGRAIGETHDKGEEAPRAEVSDLMSNLPTVVIKC